jgi:hypothetical protein
MDEFHTVRVLGQPLSSAGTPDSGSKPSSSEGVSSHGLSVGLKVLLGLVGAFALALFCSLSGSCGNGRSGISP